MSAEVRSALRRISPELVGDLFESAGAARPNLVETATRALAKERYGHWEQLEERARHHIQRACMLCAEFEAAFAQQALWCACTLDASLSRFADPSIDKIERAIGLFIHDENWFQRANSIRQGMRRRDGKDHSRFRNLLPSEEQLLADALAERLEGQIKRIFADIDGTARHVSIDRFFYFADEADREHKIRTLHIAATVEGVAEVRRELQAEDFDDVLRHPGNLLSVDYCAMRGELDVAGSGVGAKAVRRQVALAVAREAESPERPSLVQHRNFDLNSFRRRRPLPIDAFDDVLSVRVSKIGHRGPEERAGASLHFADAGTDVWDRLEALGIDLVTMDDEAIVLVEIEIEFAATNVHDRPTIAPVEIKTPNSINLSNAGEFKRRIQRDILPAWGLDAEELIEIDGLSA